MKVLCIKGANAGEITADKRTRLPKHLEIYEGEIYTVIGEETIYLSGYILAERGNEISYDKSRFIPISTIDETELVKERERVFSY